MILSPSPLAVFRPTDLPTSLRCLPPLLHHVVLNSFIPRPRFFGI